jgi:hypothetical protein
MRRSLVAVLAAVLQLGACGGDKKKDVSTSKETSTTIASDAGATTAVDSGGATTTAAAGTPKSGTSKKAGGTSGGTASGPQPGPQQATPAGVKSTAPGTYTYKVTGTAAVASPTPQKVDTTSTLKVDPLQGTDQHTSLSTPQGGQENVLRYQGDGVFIVNLKLTGPINKEFKIDPPGLAFPQPATVGKAWGWSATSTDGKTTVKSDFKILRTETIAIGSEQVPTVVVEAKVVTSGDITSTSTRTMWTSEAYRLIVRQDEKTNGKFGAFPFSIDTSSVMQSTKPS